MVGVEAPDGSPGAAHGRPAAADAPAARGLPEVQLRHVAVAVLVLDEQGQVDLGGARVYLIDKLKISEVADKRKYQIYRNSIGDREIFFGQNLEKKLSFCVEMNLDFFSNHLA